MNDVNDWTVPPVMPSWRTVAQTDSSDWAQMPTERLAGELMAHAGLETGLLAANLEALAEFVRRRGWEELGGVSAAQWLSWRCGIEPATAYERIRVAVALGGLPLTAAAMRDGRLSWSKVRSVTRVAEPDTEADWVEVAVASTAAQIDRLTRAYRRATRSDPVAQQHNESLTVSQHDNGTVELRWLVPAETGARVLAAVEAATTPEKGVPVARSRSQTLTGLVVGDTTVRTNVQLDLTVTPVGASGVAAVVSAEGIVVPDETAEVGLCDGTCEIASVDDTGEVVVSQRRSNPAPSIRRAVLARDRICRVVGCHHAPDEVHHLHYRSRGGGHDRGNLRGVCGAHHRLIHRWGYITTVNTDGSIVLCQSDGTPLEHVPSAAEALVYEPDHIPAGIGERLDLGYAISILIDNRDTRRRHSPRGESAGTDAERAA